MLCSEEFTHHLHFGMAELVDHSSELWHSFSWGSLICAASEEYVVYKNGWPVFPSDTVYFHCIDKDCKCYTNGKFHMG